MKSTLFNRNPYRVFSWTLAGLLLLLLLLEGWRHAEKPVATNRTRQTARILDDIANRFKSDQDELLDNSRDLANTLQNQIIQHQPRQALYESLQKYSSFWGASLYQGTVPIVWNDFSLEPFQDIDFSGGINPYIKVQKINNVLLWIAHIGFTIQSKDGPIPYHLLTARRIRQTNALPIGGDREYNFINETSNDKSIAIDIGIYGEIPPDTTTYRVLHSFAGDSVGVVYAKNFDFQQAITNWNESNRFWRAIYALICFVVIGVLLFIWLDNLSAWQSLFFQLLITGVGWIVFNQIHIAEFWLPPLLDGFRSQQIASYQMLCDFTVDGLFLLITALTVRDKLGRLEFQLHSTSYFSAFFAAIATGALNLFLIVVVFNSCYRLVYSTSVQLLTLQVFPGFGTILFYLCLGIIILGLTIMLLAINQFTFFVCESHLKLILVISAGTFIVGLFIAQVFISSLLILNWAFIISAVYFALVFALAYFHYRYPFSLPISSPLRKAAIYSLIISLAGSTVIYQAKTDHIDTELSQITSSYSQRKDPRAQKLTNDILERLHQEFQTLTEEDLNNRLSFIQARFTQTIESTIPDQGKVYSFDLQFIDNRENLLADYSTNLNSPNWVQVFDMKRLKAVMSIQQITNNTVRPIVQQPELEDAEVYQTFYRGWIPVYGAKSYNPIAWILCSV